MFNVCSTSASNVCGQNYSGTPLLTEQPKVMHVNMGHHSESDKYTVSMWGRIENTATDPYNFLFPRLAHLLEQTVIDAIDYERKAAALPEEVKRSIKEWNSPEDCGRLYSDGTPVTNFQLNEKLAGGKPLSLYEACAISNLESGLQTLPKLAGNFLRVVEHNHETPSPWGDIIKVGEIVSCSSCFMSASMTLEYAQNKFSDNRLLNENTNAVVLYKIHCPEAMSTAVPLLRGTLASSRAKEDNVLFPQNSCFKVEGIAVAEPLRPRVEPPVRVGVILTQIAPQLYVKNIYTGESITLRSPGVPDNNEIMPPERNSDEYAKYVLFRCMQMQPIDSNLLNKWIKDVTLAVEKSKDGLLDQHSANMITQTITHALNHSTTFRDLVNYGMKSDEDYLGDIIYRNEYDVNPEYSNQFNIKDINELSIDRLKQYNSPTSPFIPVCEAGEVSCDSDSDSDSDSEKMRPLVSFGVAPNEESQHLPSWQEGLIHEIIHHITGAKDPYCQEGENQLGATEILARKVANELEWCIPDFPGYMHPDRTNHINKRNFEVFLEAAERHYDHECAFFERLYNIITKKRTSLGFHEYQKVSALT